MKEARAGVEALRVRNVAATLRAITAAGLRILKNGEEPVRSAPGQL